MIFRNRDKAKQYKDRCHLAAVFVCCSFSAIKPPAMPVRIKGFSFKNNTSNANMRVATNRISEQL